MASSSSRKVPQLEVPSLFPTTSSRLKLNTSASKNPTQRLPPPALFQGPPSRNASHISLALPGGEGGPGSPERDATQSRLPRASRIPPASSFRAGSLQQPPPKLNEIHAESLWDEMQKTLADVELSALNPSQVFGASHAKALEDLRTAQLSLAQAWAKSEADEMGDHDFDLDAAGASIGSLQPQSGNKQKGKGGKTFSDEKRLEEETERDIQLARKRREANDRYFQQVNVGVLDVVSKLDEVANAMRRVEKESRDIWNESSDDAASVVESAVGSDASGLTDSPDETKK